MHSHVTRARSLSLLPLSRARAQDLLSCFLWAAGENAVAQPGWESPSVNPLKGIPLPPDMPPLPPAGGQGGGVGTSAGACAGGAAGAGGPA
eukprot:2368777-Pleurochrysis_carterae.AAC.1